jgi:hypothetical protein
MALACLLLPTTPHARAADLCDDKDWFETTSAERTPICNAVLDAAYNRKQKALTELAIVLRHAPSTSEAYRAREALLEMAFREGRYWDALKQADAMLAVQPDDAGVANLRPS